ncbi:MAG: hypothetical protein V2A77_04520 [Pseudomonadota bacterium]
MGKTPQQDQQGQSTLGSVVNKALGSLEGEAWAFGDDVHQGKPDSNYGTEHWAKEAGASPAMASELAEQDARTDWVNSGHNPYPVIGEPGRHFNSPSERGGYADSRDRYAEEGFQKGAEAWKRGNYEEAYKHWGQGLHGKQDEIAHGQRPYGFHPGSVDDWPARSREDQKRTEDVTKDYVRRINDAIRYSPYPKDNPNPKWYNCKKCKW